MHFGQGLWRFEIRCILPSCRSLPEGTCLPDLFEDREHFRTIIDSLGKIIRVQAPSEILDRKEPEQVRQRHHSIFGPGIKKNVVSNVIFRPEEVHCAS